MSKRPVVALVLALTALAAGRAGAEECPKSAAGAAFATGSGSGNAKADTAGLRRLGAERAAFMDALGKLRACLGPKAKDVTGWSIADVRYFDSDPIVEVDVAAAFDAKQQVTVLGSALPNAAKTAAAGGNVKQARLETTRAAVTMAQRNARESLEAAFPAADGAEGEAKKVLAGSLGGCVTNEITYWDDASVNVKLTCGKAVEAPAKVEPKAQPAIEKHAK
jgi:hypothetical protein